MVRMYKNYIGIRIEWRIFEFYYFLAQNLWIMNVKMPETYRKKRKIY